MVLSQVAESGALVPAKRWQILQYRQGYWVLIRIDLRREYRWIFGLFQKFSSMMPAPELVRLRKPILS